MATDLFFSEITKAHPDLDPVKVAELASAWDQLLHKITSRVLEITDEDIGCTVHIDQKEDLTFEMAKLLVFIVQAIISEKKKTKPLNQYDPSSEASAINDEKNRERTENTAKIIYAEIWKPTVERHRQRRALVETSVNSRKTKLIMPLRTTDRDDMHFVPQFTTRQWACPKSGKFNVFSIGIDGTVDSKDGTSKKFGKAPRLYTQAREHWFGLVEGDAKKPYEKLINTVPLNEQDRRHWIAFLLSQEVRTPKYLRLHHALIKKMIDKSELEYSSDPDHLGKLWETLFEEPEFYSHGCKLIISRQWYMATAADGLAFLRSDNPISKTGSIVTLDWQLVYPLTPTRCFVVGPKMEASEEKRIVPIHVQLTEDETNVINALICLNADKYVIGTKNQVGFDPTPIIQRHLPSNFGIATEGLSFRGVRA